MAVQWKVNTYLYTGRGDCRVHSQKTAGYSIKHSMASPVRYTPMYAARAAIVLARFSVLQMLEAIRDAMPAGDTKMIAVTCALHPYNVLDSFASNRRMGLDSASTRAMPCMAYVPVSVARQPEFEVTSVRSMAQYSRVS